MRNWAKLRGLADLTQWELGVAAEVSRNKIANVECGRVTFTEAERGRILAVLATHIGQNIAELNESLLSTERIEKD